MSVVDDGAQFDGRAVGHAAVAAGLAAPAAGGGEAGVEACWAVVERGATRCRRSGGGRRGRY